MAKLSRSNHPRRYWMVVGSLILVLGLALAALVYLTAPPDADASAGNHNTGTAAYSIAPRDSKQYFSDVENVGGKPALLADDLNWWLADLWHGKRLAYTVAALAMALALACYVTGHVLSRLALPNRPRGKDS